jgi:hypothetical protein
MVRALRRNLVERQRKAPEIHGDGSNMDGRNAAPSPAVYLPPPARKLCVYYTTIGYCNDGNDYISRDQEKRGGSHGVFKEIL